MAPSSAPGLHLPLEKLTLKHLSKKAVAAKIQMFDVKGAIRIASSDDVVAKPSQAVKDRLQSKHPSSSYSPKDFPDPNKITAENISCSKEDVRSGIQSFRNGSGAGIMGLYPQILKDLTSKEVGVAGENLLEAITKFFNEVVFPGKVPNEAFYGASLMGLEKIDRGHSSNSHWSHLETAGGKNHYAKTPLQM